MDIVDLGAENDERMARLREALALGDGFQLAIVQVEPGEQREEVLRRLQGWSGRHGVPQMELVRVAPGESPVMRLAGDHAGVILVGLEAARADDGQRFHERLAELNWSRDRLPELVNGPLVLVVSQRVQSALFEQAPDFYSWRAHTTSIVPHAAGPRPPFWAAETELEDPKDLEALIASTSSLEPSPVVELGRLHVRLAHARALRGERSQADASFDIANELFERSGAGNDRVLALLARSEAARMDGRVAEAAHWLDAARTEARKRTPTPLVTAELVAQSSRVAFSRGDLETAATELSVALSLARALGDEEREARLLLAVGALEFVARQDDTAIEVLQRAAAIFRRMGKPAGESGALTSVAAVLFGAGRSEDAERYGIDALDRAEDSGSADAIADARAFLARIAVDHGNLELAERVLAENRASPGISAQGKLLEARACLAQARGDDLAALSCLQETLELYRHTGMTTRISEVALELGNLAHRTQHWTLATTAFETADRLGDSKQRAHAAFGLARLALEQGDRSPSLAEQFAGAAQMLVDVGELAHADLARMGRGALLFLFGRFDEARQELTTAQAGYEARGQVALAAGARQMLATLDGVEPAD